MDGSKKYGYVVKSTDNLDEIPFNKNNDDDIFMNVWKKEFQINTRIGGQKIVNR